jgi:hypothetical protein
MNATRVRLPVIVVSAAGDACFMFPPDMQRSMNGWPASPDPDDLDLVWITVATRRFRVRRVAAPLFRYAIRRWHREVSPLTGGVMDEWSYAYRVIRGSTSGTLSNHSSGTAVDLDATEFPMGVRRMTRRQRWRVRRIVKACGGQLRWGGDWGYPDEMHLELAPGTTPTTVRTQVRRMGLG